MNLIVYQCADTPHSIFGFSDGDYYFVVVAHNNYGDTLSNNLHITVQLRTDSHDNVIWGYNLLFTILVVFISVMVIILFKKKDR